LFVEVEAVEEAVREIGRLGCLQILVLGDAGYEDDGVCAEADAVERVGGAGPDGQQAVPFRPGEVAVFPGETSHGVCCWGGGFW